MNRKATVAILLAVVAILIGWDIYVAVSESAVAPGAGGTISEVTLAFAQHHPVLPFLIGVVCGHLLWPQVRKPDATHS